MSDEKKVHFDGPIDQAAAGDVINQGPQVSNSNVVNLLIN